MRLLDANQYYPEPLVRTKKQGKNILSSQLSAEINNVRTSQTETDEENLQFNVYSINQLGLL